MRKLLLLITVFLLVQIGNAFAQDRQVTGKVTSSEDGAPLPGVSISIKGTPRGTTSGADGSYKIAVGKDAVLTFSFVGFAAQTVTVGGQSQINVALKVNTSQIEEVVVTALGVKRSEKSLAYSAQSVKDEQLNTIRQTNLNNALAGKVAGIQVRSQSTVALGRDASIRIRGAGSLSDKAPLYILDGNPVSSSDVNLDDVESVTVLKGPSATALYGQRGDAGVIIMASKKGTMKKGVGIELNQSTFYETVYILPRYQNSYAGGASSDMIKFNYEAGMPEEWKALNGKYYHDYSDDASWGPRMVGQEYIPWYSWYPGTQYTGKTASLVAQPNNIRDFYQGQFATNTNVNFSKAGDNYTTRISFTAQNQNGLMYKSSGVKYNISSQTTVDLGKHLTATANINLSEYTIKGQFNDGYSNQSSGSFNSWFHRDLDLNKLKELKDLTSPEGILASWNHNNPGAYASSPLNFYGANYWYNFYSYFEKLDISKNRRRMFGDVNLTYKINDNLKVAGFVRFNQGNTFGESKVPTILQTSATQTGLKAGYNTYQTYGNIVNKGNTPNEMNYELMATYNKHIKDFTVDVMAGGNIRHDSYRTMSAGTVNGLVIPDYFALSNSSSTPSLSSYRSDKEIRSMYARGSFGYKDIIFLEGSVRNDRSSALPKDANSYTYPSVGTSFIFGELIRNTVPALSFGKVRASWAQVGSDLSPYSLALNYSLASAKFGSYSYMGTPNTIVDPNIKPALSSAYELGLDLKFLKDKVGLSVTYYNEDKINEIITVPISGTSGFTSKLINAGKINRHGLEVSLNATPVKTKDVTWTTTVNWAKNTSKVLALAEGVDAITVTSDAFGVGTVVHQVGEAWGQIRGGAYTYKDGKKVLTADGMYVVTPNSYLGSVLPDFTGGWFNQIQYKDFVLSANIEFSKGGKYFSLSDYWGGFSGLFERTAGVNDKGNPIRDPIADGGGVHVQGVTADGAAVDKYVDAYTYFHQFATNKLSQEHVYDLDFIKLREVSIGYRIPVKGSKLLQSATVSIVARNPWLIYTKNRDFDPSEMSQIFGENGQFPGTRSLGVNIKLGF